MLHFDTRLIPVFQTKSGPWPGVSTAEQAQIIRLSTCSEVTCVATNMCWDQATAASAISRPTVCRGIKEA